MNEDSVSMSDFTKLIYKPDTDFIETTSRFYADLSAKQESLGEDFKQVLYDNLWDLYGS